jgi:hypothetical protein
MAAADLARNPTSFPVQLVPKNEKPGAMAGAIRWDLDTLILPRIAHWHKCAMNQTDRPLLTLDIECKLEGELNQIHALYWPRLQQMQELTTEASEIYRSIAPSKLPVIPTQRSPNALKLLLGQYAIVLFKVEAAYYPNESELLHWLDELGERVTSMVLSKVAQVEHTGSFRHVLEPSQCSARGDARCD